MGGVSQESTKQEEPAGRLARATRWGRDPTCSFSNTGPSRVVWVAHAPPSVARRRFLFCSGITLGGPLTPAMALWACSSPLYTFQRMKLCCKMIR
ncbi:hypothetical protein CEXT_757301 [Caerostris extrusa]|uniref:Uncharacterized protein n=1 Tax=Caerostris extrusa TaxID=172846 RepID=A0AAV4NYR4_CAEEX|nr:hypothetical protein CEXT_757301 [Caerostris extrusa]